MIGDRFFSKVWIWFGLIVFSFSSSSHAQDKAATSSFWILNGWSVGSAALDVANTQRCIHKGTCQEGNPLMKCRESCQYSIAVGGSVVAGYVSYRLKKAGWKTWWIIPAVNAADHTVEFGLSFRY